ncbi:Asparagine synthase family protein [Pelomyxa schiedti]|nr:Asparagine synthase family protein [Pelomyxa schiedti]
MVVRGIGFVASVVDHGGSSSLHDQLVEELRVSLSRLRGGGNATMKNITLALGDSLLVVTCVCVGDPAYIDETTFLALDSNCKLDFPVWCEEVLADPIGGSSRLAGAWSFLLLKGTRVVVGKDALGMHSLLFGLPQQRTESGCNPLLCITSVAPALPTASQSMFHLWSWKEIPTYGIFSMDLRNIVPPGAVLSSPNAHDSISNTTSTTTTSTTHPEITPTEPVLTVDLKYFQCLYYETGSSPHIAHYSTFFGSRTPEHLEPTSTENPLDTDFVQGLLTSLIAAVSSCLAHVDLVSPKLPSTSAANTPRIAMLFSGGVDSSVVAALLDRCLPPGESVELINVAFGEDAPDRQTGLHSLEELRAISKRNWIFVKVDITQEEMQQVLPQVVHLSHPNSTIMDACISAAIWFGARGIGTVQDTDGNEIPYTSKCTTLFLGQGSDEQFAGYSRHRGAFQRAGWKALNEEMQKDFNRLWTRNFGRDDRILSFHGKDVYLPFLDPNVVRYVNSLPLWQVCDVRLPPGTGDKRILREVARQLGLTDSARAVKRAIQFGSRISKRFKEALHMSCKNSRTCGKDAFVLDERPPDDE